MRDGTRETRSAGKALIGSVLMFVALIVGLTLIFIGHATAHNGEMTGWHWAGVIVGLSGGAVFVALAKDR